MNTINLDNYVVPLVVDQPFGLGDIIYSYRLVNEISEETGRKVIWPVSDEYLWVSEYYMDPNIKFISNKGISYISENCIPIRYATQFLRGLRFDDYSHDYTVMGDKYRLFNKNPKNWRNFFIQRNFVKENALFKSLIGSNTIPYILVNHTGGSNTVGHRKVDFEISNPNNYKVVELTRVDGYTLFDWLSIIELAREVHTIPTSLVYLCDNYKYPPYDSRNLHLYPSSDPFHIAALKDVLVKDWIFHE